MIHQRRWRQCTIRTLLWTLLTRRSCEMVSDSFSNVLPILPAIHSQSRWAAQNPYDIDDTLNTNRPCAAVSQNENEHDLGREESFLPAVQQSKNHSRTTVEDVMQQTWPTFSQSRRRVVQWSASLLTSFFALPATEAAITADRTTTSRIAVEATTPPAVIPFASLRRYKRITLRNGLPVLLVSDKSVSYCQAAMAVPAGQFYDGAVPGLAHLMEHMLLSTPVTSSTRRSDADLESWLTERDGASNAFTANQRYESFAGCLWLCCCWTRISPYRRLHFDRVCYHFTCPKQVFGESLERFAAVFRQKAVETVCRNRNVLRREIRRVDSELNFDSVFAQEEHLTKVRFFLYYTTAIEALSVLVCLTHCTNVDQGVYKLGASLLCIFQRQH
jgi:Insulinase (Peptidase family M16)